MTAATMHHGVLIDGGGSAGIGVAARLRRAGVTDVGLIDPADTHYYQPLWTLVGGGLTPVSASARPQASVMPKGVAWVKDAAESVDPGEQMVTTASATRAPPRTPRPARRSVTRRPSSSRTCSRP